MTTHLRVFLRLSSGVEIDAFLPRSSFVRSTNDGSNKWDRFCVLVSNGTIMVFPVSARRMAEALMGGETDLRVGGWHVSLDDTKGGIGEAITGLADARALQDKIDAEAESKWSKP